MVDKSQKVIAKWNSNNRKHFESIGYKFTHQNDELEVSIDELPRGSKDEHKDIRRDYFTISKGYKVLRFRGNYAIPTREQIINSVNYLVNSEHHHLIIDI